MSWQAILGCIGILWLLGMAPVSIMALLTVQDNDDASFLELMGFGFFWPVGLLTLLWRGHRSLLRRFA